MDMPDMNVLSAKYARLTLPPCPHLPEIPRGTCDYDRRVQSSATKQPLVDDCSWPICATEGRGLVG